MQKKSNTSRGARATKPKSHSELAQLLLQVLSHPELPVCLFDAITDVLLDMASSVEYDKAEMIEISLNAFERREEKRKERRRTHWSSGHGGAGARIRNESSG